MRSSSGRLRAVVFFLAFVFVGLLACWASFTRPAQAATRGSACYTAWDDYYFYAAFQVDDPHVVSMNSTPLSNPQQDDDIEVFFDTKGPGASSARTPGTYQMAVSANNGGYFSVGDANGKPKAKLVFTYKYAATVDGTLNKNDDTDIGYTVEIAIPWRELGLSGPPKDGAVWGFNAINRDRASMTTPANHFASLSAGVKGAADVQDPQKWTKITFTTSPVSQQSGPNGVYCPHVVGHFPIIDGVVRSGEWFRADGFALGPPAIAANAPTVAEEPNVDTTADQAFQQAIAETPPPTTINPKTGQMNTPPEEPPGPTPAPPTQGISPSTGAQASTAPVEIPGYDIQLPGGGMVHVGKLQPPPPTVEVEQPQEQPQPPKGKHSRGKSGSVQVAEGPNGPFGPQFPAVGPNVDVSQTLRLIDQNHVSPLFLALYDPDIPRDAQTIDQPAGGMGSWYGGGSVQYQVDQLKDARRSGVDVLLVNFFGVERDGSDSGGPLATLVQALEYLKSSGADYPLLGVSVPIEYSADRFTLIQRFFEQVPPEFRAEVFLPDAQGNAPEYIAALRDASGDAASLKDQFAKDFAGEGAGLFVLNAAADGKGGLQLTSASSDISLSEATVSPTDSSALQAGNRKQGDVYNASWRAATDLSPDWVLLDSWNDYIRGSEVAETRQYGEHYADLTKLNELQYTSGQEWSARYLKCNAPSEMSPNSLYTAQVRIENSGTLPWRLGEDYSLSYRWYKDGRLYDDSAPKLPVNTDVYPGDSITMSVGILPHNQYGSPLEPGDYTLVFDMVQSADRWFTLAGDTGLKVHVRVLDGSQPPAARATFIGSSLPTRIQAGAAYKAVVTVRNDSGTIWKAGDCKLVFNADPGPLANTMAVTGGSTLAKDVPPGEVAKIPVTVTITGSDSMAYKVKWTIHNPDMEGHYLQVVRTVPADLGASFVLSDIPRNLKTGQTAGARLGIANTGPETWTKGHWEVGYHWAYLDGDTAQRDGDILTPFGSDVPPGTVTAVTAKFQAPNAPGRYYLVWDVRGPDGLWSSELGQKMRPAGSLPALVSVTAGGNSATQQVRLDKYFDVIAAGYENGKTPDGGGFDGNGGTVPAEQLPPDGANDDVSNPVLTDRPGEAPYPSGYYALAGGGDHKIGFRLTDQKDGKGAVTCRGQKIDLPGGYSSIHLLAAATGSSTETAAFKLDNGQAVSVSIAPWSESPKGIDAAIGLRFPYRLNNGAVDASAPCVLGDYRFDTPGGSRSITLPNSPNVKILAITVAR